MQKIKRDLLPFIRCFPFISHCYSSLTLLTFARFCIPLITIRLSIILFSIAERSYPGNLSAVVGCLIASNSEFFHFSNCQIEIVWVFSLPKIGISQGCFFLFSAFRCCSSENAYSGLRRWDNPVYALTALIERNKYKCRKYWYLRKQRLENIIWINNLNIT